MDAEAVEKALANVRLARVSLDQAWSYLFRKDMLPEPPRKFSEQMPKVDAERAELMEGMWMTWVQLDLLESELK